MPRDEAIAFMKEKEEPYKVELIEDLPEGCRDQLLPVRVSLLTCVQDLI